MSAAVTVTAVSTSLDTLTATAHGLLTGDRFRLRNVGGALPAATPALAPTVDYFAIRVDADTIKVSDTNAHALAGTGIFDLTGAGSGTTTIEYGLPYTMPTVLPAQGGQIRSADVSSAWTSLVALYGLLTAQVQSIWSSISLAVDLVMAANKNITVSGTGDYKHGDRVLTLTGTGFIVQSGSASFTLEGSINSTASCVLLREIPLRVGDRIKSITATFDSNTGTVDVTDFRVDKITSNGTATSLGSTTVNNIGTPTTTTVDLTDTTLAANQCFLITVQINATGCAVRNVGVTYDRP